MVGFYGNHAIGTLYYSVVWHVSDNTFSGQCLVPKKPVDLYWLLDQEKG